MKDAKKRKLLQKEALVKQSRLGLEYVKEHLGEVKKITSHAASSNERSSTDQSTLGRGFCSIISGTESVLREPGVQKLLALFLTALLAKRIQTNPRKKHRLLRWLSRLL